MMVFNNYFGRGTPSAHEMTTGRVFYQKISPLKGQIVIYRADLGRTRAGVPPSLATRASYLGNPGLTEYSGNLKFWWLILAGMMFIDAKTMVKGQSARIGSPSKLSAV